MVLYLFTVCAIAQSWRPEDSLGSQFCFSILWVSGIKLRLSDMAAESRNQSKGKDGQHLYSHLDYRELGKGDHKSKACLGY